MSFRSHTHHLIHYVTTSKTTTRPTSSDQWITDHVHSQETQTMSVSSVCCNPKVLATNISCTAYKIRLQCVCCDTEDLHYKSGERAVVALLNSGRRGAAYLGIGQEGRVEGIICPDHLISTFVQGLVNILWDTILPHSSCGRCCYSCHNP
ncbi:hypothetical protein E2C01_068904 [Portunus trituberculatus]|uniref:Uncharacterized protein n=1 Tax=Portunus trituberculatus TaxID=210409 RepID=A0A5B7I1E3_PORTR|nr:hypothetical protein [Portunus trituberculatus]